ncbi:30S ribosomal protein S4 [Candidatus Bathyarchaeota archaeon]|nr:30S ribosomal protein S4 [Candidatus Bathyarchaeota archaeon]
MGDPKRQRRKYVTPRYPWQKDVLDAELKLLGEYGLRNKRELWRHHTMLSKYRKNARTILAKPPEERAKLEKELLTKFYRLGIVSETATIDDILDLSIEDLLERRLQTIVFRNGLAKSLQQARQLITHGHIFVNGRKVTAPSYLVLRGEEASITYAPTSPVANPEHPIRKAIITPPKAEPTSRKIEEEVAV